jgi:hypothetical protein
VGSRGATLKEGNNINKSLSVLGRCIKALVDQAKASTRAAKQQLQQQVVSSNENKMIELFVLLPFILLHDDLVVLLGHMYAVTSISTFSFSCVSFIVPNSTSFSLLLLGLHLLLKG